MGYKLLQVVEAEKINWVLYVGNSIFARYGQELKTKKSSNTAIGESTCRQKTTGHESWPNSQLQVVFSSCHLQTDWFFYYHLFVYLRKINSEEYTS